MLAGQIITYTAYIGSIIFGARYYQLSFYYIHYSILLQYLFTIYRWYAWNEYEELSILQDGFTSHGVPLDQLSIDMDWHPAYPRGLDNPYNVNIEGWTGTLSYI